MYIFDNDYSEFGDRYSDVQAALRLDARFVFEGDDDERFVFDGDEEADGQ